MTTKCPLGCGKHIDFRDIDKHIAAHDRADAIEKKIKGMRDPKPAR